MRNTVYLLTVLFCGFWAGPTAKAAPSLCGSVSGNLVANCGFETGDLTGWTASPTGYNGILYGVDAVDAYSGTYGAYLGGFGTAAMFSQSLATTSNTRYTISFYLAHPDNTISPYNNSFSVSFGGRLLYAQINGAYSYQPITLYGLASSSLSTLQFSATDPNFYFSLDDVTVTAGVPEPASLALAVPGLALLLFVHLRRRLGKLPGVGHDAV